MSTLEIVLLVVSVLSVSYIVGQWLLKEDQEVKARREAAAELAAKLQSFGLVKIPAFLIAYSTGNYVKCGEAIKQLVDLFVHGGESAVTKEFELVFDNCLKAKLTSASGLGVHRCNVGRRRQGDRRQCCGQRPRARNGGGQVSHQRRMNRKGEAITARSPSSDLAGFLWRFQ